MEQIFSDWLQHPESEEEKAELQSIRITYLPEIIFAYISAIYFDGHTLSREILLKIMNLAIDVAANGSEVGACLRAARRMTEMMDYMAVGSLAVLRAEEAMAKKRGGKIKKIPCDCLAFQTGRLRRELQMESLRPCHTASA